MTAGPHDVYLEKVERARKVAAKLERIYRDGDEWKGGVRPPVVVETLDDVQWAWLNRETGRPLIVCGYCCERRKIRSEREGRDWFRLHECAAEGWEVA